MRCKSPAAWCAVGMLVASTALAAEEPAEQVTTVQLVPATPYRIYLADFFTPYTTAEVTRLRRERLDDVAAKARRHRRAPRGNGLSDRVARGDWK
ncbi:MAG TPA: hypothetical protein VF814_14045 [Casimicrobiaceae bacterium]